MPAIDELLDVMRRLRDPETGCAWDLEQDFASIAPYTIEEAYEVADAIERNDLRGLKDELGDLLLQVVFHAQIAAEQSVFDFTDVAQAIVDKMIRRHPHVFGNSNVTSTAELEIAWEAEKARERAAVHGDSDAMAPSALDGIARNLPALKFAGKLQSRAARIGFDWTELPPVWDKLNEEISEVHQAAAEQDADALEDEFGDVLFAVVNLVRHYNLDAESALRRANRKFETRFRRVETLAHAKLQNPDELSLEELDELWKEAKKQLQSQ